MLTARALAAMWLLLVGVIWLIVSYIVITVMSGISTFVVPVWLALTAGFGPPIVLIIASILVLAQRYTRTAVMLASVTCAWLTWAGARDLWPSKPENSAIAPMQYDWLYFAEFLFVL